jgi:cold shock CspA family protein
LERALKVLQSALEANPAERRLHYSYAKLLRLQEGTKGEELAYHLQRAFTPGDANYDAQLLYGRQLFINGDRDGSKVVFARLRNALVPSDVRDRLLYPLDQTFRGSIARMEATYCFIARDGQADWLYAHRNNMESSVWKDLIWGSRVSFRIAFALRGVNAYDVDLKS